MSKSYRIEDEFDSVLDFDGEEAIPSRDYERNRNRLEVRRGIENYFERKHLKQLDDWFDED